jgi:uncharacterized protein YutE (UPF0331/DUF86 family)
MIAENKVAAKLERLGNYVGYLRGYQEHSLHDLESDHTLRGAVERYFQLSIECVIDICEIIISDGTLGKPEEYRHVIDILGENGILPKEFAYSFAPITGFRKLLVHEYAKIDLKILYEHLQKNLDDIETFATYISEFFNTPRQSMG